MTICLGSIQDLPFVFHHLDSEDVFQIVSGQHSEYRYSRDLYVEGKLKEDVYEKIVFSKIARSFLKYYWHQICKYKIRQNYNPDKSRIHRVRHPIVDVPDCSRKSSRHQYFHLDLGF